MSDDSLLGQLKEAFKRKPPAGAPAGMTFEQRAALIGALYGLLEQRELSLREWGLQLRQAFSYADVTKPLVEAIPTDEPIPFDRDERRAFLTNIARTGLRLAETHPIAAFGGDASSLLVEGVERAVYQSRLFRLMRWLAPVIVALAIGGVAWSGVQFDGLQKKLQAAEDKIQSKQDEVTEKASATEAEITKTSNEAQRNWVKTLATATNDKIGEVGEAITQAKAEAKPRVEAQLHSIVDWGVTERENITQAGQQELAELDKLKPNIAQAQAAVGPRVNAEMEEIIQWGTDKKQELTKAVAKQQGEIDKITPLISQVNANIGSRSQQALNEIGGWTEVKRNEISKAAETAKSALSETLSKEKAALEKVTADAAAARTAGGALVARQVDDIAEWGRGRRDDVAKALDAAKSSVDQVMEQRQREVAAEAGRVTTQLGELLVDARKREDDLHARLLAAEARMQGLNGQVAELRGTVRQASALQSAFEQAGQDSKLSLGLLIKILEWRDVLILAVAAAAFLILVIELVRCGRWIVRRRRRVAA